MFGATYDEGPLTTGAGSVVAGSDCGGAVCFFLPPTTPPTMDATITAAKTAPNAIQKFRRRMPHILRTFGSGGNPGAMATMSSIVFG